MEHTNTPDKQEFEKYPELANYIQEYASHGHFSDWTGFIESLNNALKSQRDEIREDIEKLRDDLYEKIPVGEVHAFDLINLINSHVRQLDSLLANKEEKKSIKLLGSSVSSGTIYKGGRPIKQEEDKPQEDGIFANEDKITTVKNGEVVNETPALIFTPNQIQRIEELSEEEAKLTIIKEDDLMAMDSIQPDFGDMKDPLQEKQSEECEHKGCDNKATPAYAPCCSKICWWDEFA